VRGSQILDVGKSYQRQRSDGTPLKIDLEAWGSCSGKRNQRSKVDKGGDTVHIAQEEAILVAFSPREEPDLRTSGGRCRCHHGLVFRDLQTLSWLSWKDSVIAIRLL
jgi:hypothetical protein